MKPIEKLIGQKVQLDIFDFKDYKKMKLIELHQNKFNAKNYKTELGNRIFRLKNEVDRMNKLIVKLETLIEDKFIIGKGFRRIEVEK